MKCMLLAAGRGERLRPRTDETPKPLIEVAGTPLIEYHLHRLKKAGIEDIVINISHLGQIIQQHLGNGNSFGVHIEYSDEGEQALETAGGIIHAMPLLGDDHFLVLNSDIWCDHDLSFATLSSDKHAHLVLVDNPDHNANGDFSYENEKISNNGNNFLTFSGIGIYHPNFFENQPTEKLALAPLIRDAVDNKLVSAEYFSGNWFDIGTEQRLKQAEKFLEKNKA